MVTSQELVVEARERAGLEDLGSEHVLELVAAVAQDLRGDTMTERGRRIVRSMVIGTLVKRLRVVETLRRHPEIADVELPPIVHVGGLPRSGTTLLHNVLARHPGVRTLQSWELKEPLPPPEAATYATDPRIAAADAALAPLRGSELEHLHWVEATDPDESQWAMTDLTGLLGGGGVQLLPRLGAVVHDRGRSMRPTFTELRQTLQLLLWRNPVPAGHVLVLKDPTTTSHLPDLVEVFPDAAVVTVHRDPHRVTVSSVATGNAVMAPLASGSLRSIGWTPEVTRDWLVAQYGGLLDGIDAAGDRAHHLAYPTLAADPVAATASLLDDLGLDGADPGFTTAAERYLAWQRDGGRARPRPSYDDHGLTAEYVRGTPTVAAYCDRFDVVPEQRRLTGAG